MEAANGAVSKIEALELENPAKKDEIQRLKKEIDSLPREAPEEARSEAAALKNLLEERESTVALLERETKSLKQLNAESEMKVRDLERKLSVAEVRESEERSKRVRAEEETREKVGEKEREIEEMKQRIEELEKVKVVEMREKGERVDGGWKKGLGLVLWPVMAAGSGAVAAVFYFCFRKRSR